MKFAALQMDCKEPTMDEELALASSISDSLKGHGMALINGDKIVLDSFGQGEFDERAVEAVVSEFVAHRKGHKFYSVERNGDSIVVRSADPVAAARKRPTEKLPQTSSSARSACS